MILNNLLPVGSGGIINIRIDDAKITEVSDSVINDRATSLELAFDNAIVFPGLINSHDHLDFNLFPQLGDKVYNNYTEWGKYIHQNYKTEIAQVLKIPAVLRAQWGIYKNLLCGVTTVVNHGEKLGTANDLITVFEQTHCLHSVRFEKNWRFKLNNPLKRSLPINIHAGEGSDGAAADEIDQLISWNLLRKKLIGVHAVAMSAKQARKFDAIVWCPQSNYFLLNKTAPVDMLSEHTTTLFGTDSTLTSNWNIWNHLQTAREIGLLSDEYVYSSLTNKAADVWQLNSGKIEAGKDADIVVAKKREGLTSYDAFFAVKPEDLLLVMHKGQVRLADETIAAQLDKAVLKGFSKININGACKYVEGDLPQLISSIQRYNPEAKFPVSLTQQFDKCIV